MFSSPRQMSWQLRKILPLGCILQQSPQGTTALYDCCPASSPSPAVVFQHVCCAQMKQLCLAASLSQHAAACDPRPSNPCFHRLTRASRPHADADASVRPATALLHDRTTSAWQPCHHHCRLSPFSSARAVCVPIMEGGRPSSACSSSQEASGLLVISNAAGTLTDRQALVWR